ncbi:MAG: AMP-binding protein [Chloroflexota bacterium]
MAIKNEYFDKLETMSPGEREAYVSRKLAQVVRYAYRQALAMKELMDKAGTSPSQVRTVKDLEKIPITRKTELIEAQKSRPPYGGFLTIPSEEVERVFITPGPIYEPLHTRRIKWFGKSFFAAGFRKGDVVINAFTYHLSPAGILFHEALRDCGATVIPVGTGNTELQLQAMRDLRVTGIACTPSFLMTLIKRAEEMGFNLRRDLSLKRAWFIGEMLPPSLRRTLEEDYKVDTYQTYGVTELGGAIAYECREKSGMHLMDEYLVEIVEPATGRQLGTGEVGEIVVTPLLNQRWGVVRFGTGDLSSITAESCPCGRTSPRLTGILGRTGEAVKVRGMFIVARQVEQTVLGFAPISRFQIAVSRRNERDEMTLCAELRQEASEEERRRLAEEMNRKFQDVCRVKIDRITFVPSGTIPEGQKTLVDERVWK